MKMAMIKGQNQMNDMMKMAQENIKMIEQARNKKEYS